MKKMKIPVHPSANDFCTALIDMIENVQAPKSCIRIRIQYPTSKMSLFELLNVCDKFSRKINTSSNEGILLSLGQVSLHNWILWDIYGVVFTGMREFDIFHEWIDISGISDFEKSVWHIEGLKSKPWSKTNHQLCWNLKTVIESAFGASDRVPIHLQSGPGLQVGKIVQATGFFEQVWKKSLSSAPMGLCSNKPTASEPEPYSKP